MIRINLLGVPRAKKGGSRAAAAAMGGGGGEGLNIIVVIALVAIIAAAANGWWYNKLTNDQKQIAKEIAAAEFKNKQLADVKAKYLQRQREADNYKRRVDVIDQLRNNQQAGEVSLLTQVGDTVNGTDAVWLSTMSEDGNFINLAGTALSVDAMANLMTNLKKTGYFKNVELQESYQDTSVKDMQAFLFTLKCEKKS